MREYPVSHRLPGEWRAELTTAMAWITQRGWEAGESDAAE
jgi:hypothetical protein